ncbi:M23 family metallopeptidase [Paenibacillus terreus]|uniref:M23 family metallopeptidase n=1 Tax=Paenibacillus terreus TaxID=1387834 RepID=A0ABV5BBP7_9BACL
MFYYVVKMLIVPLILYWIIAYFPFKSRISWYIHAFFTSAYTFMILFINDWTEISYYLRPVCILLFVCSLLRKMIFLRSIKPGRLNKTTKIFIALYGLLAMYQCLISILIIITYMESVPKQKEAVDLMFPLKGGLYEVVNGGMNSSMNYHFSYRSLKYAVDITKLTPLGSRKERFGTMDPLTSYPVYNDSVYSPVDGRIVEVMDGIDDNVPNVLGGNAANMVIINYKDYDILLLHLKKNSLLVKKDDFVRAGQELAKVGNSGYSSEPHLHIHAIRHDNSSDYFNGTSVPITFHGIYLKRNDLLLDQTLIFR